MTPWTACWRAVIAGSISQVPLLVMNVTSVCGTFSDQVLSHCVERLTSVIFCLLVFVQSSHIFFLSRYRCDVVCQVGPAVLLLDLVQICKTEKVTQMYRTDFRTLWEKVRVGCFERTASKHIYYTV